VRKKSISLRDELEHYLDDNTITSAVRKQSFSQRTAREEETLLQSPPARRRSISIAKQAEQGDDLSQVLPIVRRRGSKVFADSSGLSSQDDDEKRSVPFTSSGHIRKKSFLKLDSASSDLPSPYRKYVANASNDYFETDVHGDGVSYLRSGNHQLAWDIHVGENSQGDSFLSLYSSLPDPSYHSRSATAVTPEKRTTPHRHSSNEIAFSLSAGHSLRSSHSSNADLKNTRESHCVSEKRILMVDDSAISLKLCVKLFRKLGATVDDALDGTIALEKMFLSLSSYRAMQGLADSTPLVGGYDLVIMDNLMPKMNGTVACRKMREAGYIGIIIGLTGNALPEDVEEYLQHGANAVLRKPLDIEEFCTTLEIIKSSQGL